LNFLQVLKNDHSTLYAYLKTLILTQKTTSLPDLSAMQGTSSDDYERPRKGSDPTFENQEYLQKMEDKFVK